MQSTTPAFFLALAYWLHMLATVAWLGGLSALALLVIPAARKTLSPESYAGLLGRLQEKISLVGWMSLAVLGGTGMFQMSAAPQYQGLLAIENPWAVAMLSKHIAVLVMVALSAYSTWGLLPAMRRLAILRSAGKVNAAEEQSQMRSEQLLLTLNLILSVLVLALTAWARAS